MTGNDHCGTLGLSGALVPWCGCLSVAFVEPDAPGLPPPDSPASAHKPPACLGLQMLPVSVISVVCFAHPPGPSRPCLPPSTPLASTTCPVVLASPARR